MMSNDILMSLMAGGFAIIVAMIGTNNRTQKAEAAQVQRALGRLEGKIDQHLAHHK